MRLLRQSYQVLCDRNRRNTREGRRPLRMQHYQGRGRRPRLRGGASSRKPCGQISGPIGRGADDREETLYLCRLALLSARRRMVARWKFDVISMEAARRRWGRRARGTNSGEPSFRGCRYLRISRSVREIAEFGSSTMRDRSQPLIADRAQSDWGRITREASGSVPRSGAPALLTSLDV